MRECTVSTNVRVERYVRRRASMCLTPLKYLKLSIFVKLLILRYQFIGITLSKPHLVCTFYDKQINVKKYDLKFGSVQILMARQCIYGKL